MAPDAVETRGTVTGAGGAKLVYAARRPAAPRAVVAVVHGYGEHIGRYRHVVAALAACGFAVYAVDQRGHGESEGPRANVERFEYFVDDLHRLVLLAREAHPALPVFLLGHSMGGLIAVHYALRHEPALAGLVLSGASLHLGEGASPLLKLFSPLIARLLPQLPVVNPRPGGESVLSSVPEVQRLFDADPLCYKGPVLARMGYQLLRAAAAAQREMARLSLPLLIMHGAEDTFVSHTGPRHLYDVARSADKTLRFWPGCRHEIFNERDGPAIVDFTCEWIAARAGTATGAGPGAGAGTSARTLTAG